MHGLLRIAVVAGGRQVAAVVAGATVVAETGAKERRLGHFLEKDLLAAVSGARRVHQRLGEMLADPVRLPAAPVVGEHKAGPIF